MRAAVASLSTPMREGSVPAQPRVLQTANIHYFALPTVASERVLPAPPRPLLPGPPAPVETARHTHMWRSACRHVMRPVMRAYESYAGRKLRKAGFTSKFIQTPQGVTMHAIHTRGTGSRPPIVFIHGLSGSCRSYYDVLLRFKGEFREVIALDLPGHGSSVPYQAISTATFVGAVRAALDTLLHVPGIVFGHSLGGFVAAHYAALSPQKVAGLVLASPAGGPMREDTRREMVRLFEVGTHHDAVALAGRTFAPPSWKTQLFAAGTTTRFANPDLQRLVHSHMSTERLPRSLLRTLQPPTLFSWGEFEQLLPADHFDYFRKHLPETTKIKMLPGVNHSSIADANSPLMDELLKFTQRRSVRHRAAAAAA